MGRGPHSRVDAREAAVRLLEGLAPPTAVFGASDMQAIGVLQAAEQLGVRVPEDLAVIGFDGTETAEIVALTTIRQPLEQSGATGMEMLLAELAGDGVAGDVIKVPLPLELVERRTT